MEVPHYKQAPITGHNLHALAKCYYGEYKPMEGRFFESMANSVNKTLAKYDEYKEYNMDVFEAYCQAAKPHINRIDKPGLLSSLSQHDILLVVFKANLDVLPFSLNGKTYPVVDSLRKFLQGL